MATDTAASDLNWCTLSDDFCSMHKALATPRVKTPRLSWSLERVLWTPSVFHRSSNSDHNLLPYRSIRVGSAHKIILSRYPPTLPLRARQSLVNHHLFRRLQPVVHQLHIMLGDNIMPIFTRGTVRPPTGSRCPSDRYQTYKGEACCNDNGTTRVGPPLWWGMLTDDQPDLDVSRCLVPTAMTGGGGSPE